MKNVLAGSTVDYCDNCEGETTTLWEMSSLGMYCCPSCFQMLEKSMKRSQGNKFSRFAEEEY